MKNKKKIGSCLGESTLTSCERKHYKDCKLDLLACCFLNENSLDTFLSLLKPCPSNKVTTVPKTDYLLTSDVTVNISFDVYLFISNSTVCNFYHITTIQCAHFILQDYVKDW